MAVIDRVKTKWKHTNQFWKKERNFKLYVTEVVGEMQQCFKDPINTDCTQEEGSTQDSQMLVFEKEWKKSKGPQKKLTDFYYCIEIGISYSLIFYHKHPVVMGFEQWAGWNGRGRRKLEREREREEEGEKERKITSSGSTDNPDNWASRVLGCVCLDFMGETCYR